MREMLRQRSEGNGEDRRNERMRGREGQMDGCERQVRRATIGGGEARNREDMEVEGSAKECGKETSNGEGRRDGRKW